MYKEPPEATVIEPCTSVNWVLLIDVLNCRVPRTVVVLAVAVEMSIVTVSPDWTEILLQLVGTAAGFQLAALDQAPPPVPFELISPQPAVQRTLLFRSNRSNVGPDRA